MKPIWDPQVFLAKTTLTTAFLSLGLSSCATENPGHDLHVTNGREQSGFDYVVLLRMDSGGTCTGSFVSDSLLLTAAHCVDRSEWVEVGSRRAYQSQIFIHKDWPSLANNWQGQRLARHDLALVAFTPGSFKPQMQGTDAGFTASGFAELAARQPSPGEPIKIAGYGNNAIEPFTTYCRMRRQPGNDGRCNIDRGVHISGALYEYSPLIEFFADTSSMPAQCNQGGLRESLAETGTDFREFVREHCDGNLRDRPYRESGVGHRRSGENTVDWVGAGVITFNGKLAGPGNGAQAASGAGDSGGPLFIRDHSGWKLAGVTHGGSLGENQNEGVSLSESSLVKRSVYVSLRDPNNIGWLTTTVATQYLDFPGLE